MTGCASNKPRLVVLHPPIADLKCEAEPAVPPETSDDAAFLAFDRDVLLAGRSCRSALARACAWHKGQGAVVEC